MAGTTSEATRLYRQEQVRPVDKVETMDRLLVLHKELMHLALHHNLGALAGQLQYHHMSRVWEELDKHREEIGEDKVAWLEREWELCAWGSARSLTLSQLLKREREKS